MPQGRRKVPFSGKAKKEQLQHKRQLRMAETAHSEDEEEYLKEDKVHVMTSQGIMKTSIKSGDRYSLQFAKESKRELERRKDQAFQSLQYIHLQDQEVSNNYYPLEVDIPKRPPWDYSMTKAKLESREQTYFAEYMDQMQRVEGISYFELNLETWRQLWRVLEMSDILLIIVDIRFTVLMFPPYLYNYVTNTLKKDMILILNKVDLASPALVVAWKEYFHLHYPKLHILMFTSFPTYNLRGNTSNEDGLKTIRRKGKMKMAAEGARSLLKVCEDIVKGNIDLSSWNEKIQEEMNLEYEFDEVNHKDLITIVPEDTSYFEHEKYKNGVLTIGCIGTPNVGKSSLMNALMGKKVVSVSRTPGHTKHFQTIYLTKTVRLCDCPGLVFPSVVPKQLQILMGTYPIAQVREPYTTVKYLAERLDLPRLLKIQHPENDDTWSAMDICTSWAKKKGFITGQAGRPDTYRAANQLLRISLEGKICLFIYPPDWSKNKKNWGVHEDIETVQWIQARNQVPDNDIVDVYTTAEGQETCSKSETMKKSKGATNNNSVASSSEKTPIATNKFALLSEMET